MAGSYNMGTKQEIIRDNTRIAEDIVFKIMDLVRPGSDTKKIDEFAGDLFKLYSASPATRYFGYRCYVSIAINEEVFFGKISKNRKIGSGDVVKLALGVLKDGFYSDMAVTLVAGRGSAASRKLIGGTAAALCSCMDKVRAGNTIGDVSSSIEQSLVSSGLVPVEGITGHGIGRTLHEEPAIPNSTDLPFIKYSTKLEDKMVVCLEPIASTGNGKIIRRENMSFITEDNEPVAHFEFPVQVRDGEVDILAKRLFEYMKKASLGNI
jgi:methionyl aminopeptidase